MFVKYLKWVFIYVLINNVCVLSQICTSRRVVTKRVMEENVRWYTETYNGRCYRSCILTRWTTKKEQVSVTKREVQSFHVCCNGYINSNDEVNGLANKTMPITCKPICMPACTNGFCISPGNCSCHSGYTVDPKNKHNCLPQCLKDCNHGTCVAPETCQCNFGYKVEDGTCHPVCTEPCDNGTCVAPETCECLPGYRKSDRNTCEPYCSSGCLHGTCVNPETCVCRSGFTMQVINSENNTSCQPDCQPPCQNGSCVAPNVCECNSGYQISGGLCKSHCSHGCLNGNCINPEICICNKGWRMDNDTVCRPISDVDSDTGTSNSTSTCQRGYKLNEVSNNDVIDTPMCVPICNNCEGSCVEPNVCICDPPYKAQSLAADGRACDCHENCTEAMRKCERTVCVFIEQSLEYDEATKESSSSKDAVYDTTEEPNNNHTTGYENDSGAEASSMTSQNWNWIYVALTACTILIIIFTTIIVFMKWKYIIIYFKGSSYVVEDNKEDIDVFECSLHLKKEKHGDKIFTIREARE